jgi:hypothetical protein
LVENVTTFFLKNVEMFVILSGEVGRENKKYTVI